MKLYSPELAGTYIWQVADPKSSKTSFAPSKSQNPPPNCVYGHPLGRYDSDGCYWTYCPNTGEEDPNSPRSSRFVKHPLADEEQRLAVKEKVWGSIHSFGSYKETEFLCLSSILILILLMNARPVLNNAITIAVTQLTIPLIEQTTKESGHLWAFLAKSP